MMANIFHEIHHLFHATTCGLQRQRNVYITIVPRGPRLDDDYMSICLISESGRSHYSESHLAVLLESPQRRAHMHHFCRSYTN